MPTNRIDQTEQQSLAHPVIFFDGICNLCNQSVQFIIRHDQREIFKFASLQSAYAQSQLADSPDLLNLDTFVLLEQGRIYTRSTAFLRVCRKLDGAWAWMYALILVPKSLRDAVYRFIAKNRYRWFGQTEACMLPSKELRERFLG